MARRFLLSIDGGGLRGIIPVSALAALEGLTGRPVRETFSFLAGTSTGAIIVAGLAAGVPAERLLDFYRLEARRVFRQYPWTAARRVISGSMYDTATLRELIRAGLGPARDWTLNDAPVDLLITAKRVVDGKPWYFVRDKPANSRRTGRLPLADCATASAAEPTYFEPWTIPEDPGGLAAYVAPVGRLVGGGVGVAGNPVYQACVEAFYYTGEYRPAETTVVSLGTGRFIGQKSPSHLWTWLEWVLGELLRSPGEQQTEIVHRHFVQDQEPPMVFYRLDPELPRDIPLDDTGSVEELQRIGEAFAASIDWESVLAGRDTSFLVSAGRTHWPQYSRKVG